LTRTANRCYYVVAKHATTIQIILNHVKKGLTHAILTVSCAKRNKQKRSEWMDANSFFFALAERRFLEPEPEKKSGPHCKRCGRAIDAREFETGGVAFIDSGTVCRECANIER
jgi:hypothetical protein